MKIKPNTTLYICEHCRKRYVVEKACIEHEPKCTKNPENVAKCSGCAYLKETQIEYHYDTYCGSDMRMVKSFFCTKLNKGVYPAKVVHTGLYEKYAEELYDQIQMPTECEHFEFTW